MLPHSIASVPKRIAGGVTGAAMTALLVLAATAPAHHGHQGEQVVVERMSPVTEGVRVRPVPGGLGKLALTTTGSTSAEVLSVSGQPILRVGPEGVEANAAAPEWYKDNEPLGAAQVPASATRRARTRWILVSRRRSWEWFDHRLHPPGSRVNRWSIPIAVDGIKTVVQGRIEGAPGTFQLRLDGRSPAPGVRVSAIEGPSSALRLRNDGDAPVRVLGPDGEVFARVGPRGAEVNVHSSVWLPTAQYRNRDLLSSVIDPPAKPEFMLLTPETELIWPDPRLLPHKRLPALNGGSQNARPVEVAKWSVPVVVEGAKDAVAIEGTTWLVSGAAGDSSASQAGGGDSPVTTTDQDDGLSAGVIALCIAAAVALIAGAGLVVRSRR